MCGAEALRAGAGIWCYQWDMIIIHDIASCGFSGWQGVEERGRIWHIWVAFLRFLSVQFPPFLLSLSLVCIDVKWGDAFLFLLALALAFITLFLYYLIICMIV